MTGSLQFPPADALSRWHTHMPAGVKRSEGAGSNDLSAGLTRLHDLNKRIAICLAAVVFLAPIPLGSNRPAFWAISAAAIGLLGLWYALRAPADTELRVPLARYKYEALIFPAFCVYLLVQVLPVGTHGFATPEGALSSTRLSLAPGDTLLMLMRQVGYGVFVFLTLQVAANRQRARWLLRITFGAITVYAAIGLVSLQWGDTFLGLPKTAYLGFATGTFVNRNSFATFLAAGVVIGVALLVELFAEADRPRDLLKRGAEISTLLVALAVISAALVATGSRMGVVAAVCGSLVVLLLGTVSHKRRQLTWIALALVIGGVCILLGFGTGLAGRVVSLEESIAGRDELYRQVWEMILLRPWSGYGGGSFAVAFPLFQHPPLAGEFVWDKAHSTYLALWSELGLIAGSLPIVLVLMLCVRSLIALRRSSNFVLSLAAIGVVTAFALHALVDFSLEIQADTYLFLFVLTLGAAGFSDTGKPRLEGRK